MIALLEGKVAENNNGQIVLLCHGVGYGVSMASSDTNKVFVGDDLRVYVYENIKEDTHDLFGFMSIENKKLFEQLLSVKNVGPKVAMSILEIGSVAEVRSAIAGGDVKKLQSAKGVGKRAAEQIVVELRDKVGLMVTGSAEDIVVRSGIDSSDEAAQALVALGYSELDAALALKSIDTNLPVEDRIKLALKSR